MKRIVSISGIALMLVVLLAAGCQSTIAALTSTLGNAAAGIAALQGNSSLATQLRTDTAAAVTAVQGWKQGTPAQNAVQALNIVVDDLNLICPTTAQGGWQQQCASYAPLIVLAVGTAQSIIQILAPNQALRSPRLNPTITPHTAQEFKERWNNLCLASPELAQARL